MCRLLTQTATCQKLTSNCTHHPRLRRVSSRWSTGWTTPLWPVWRPNSWAIVRIRTPTRKLWLNPCWSRSEVLFRWPSSGRQLWQQPGASPFPVGWTTSTDPLDSCSPRAKACFERCFPTRKPSPTWFPSIWSSTWWWPSLGRLPPLGPRTFPFTTVRRAPWTASNGAILSGSFSLCSFATRAFKCSALQEAPSRSLAWWTICAASTTTWFQPMLLTALCA